MIVLSKREKETLHEISKWPEFPEYWKPKTRAKLERLGLVANGFGYDPIFYVPEFGKTTAELTEEEKNQVSHRGKALELMKEELKKYEDTDRK